MAALCCNRPERSQSPVLPTRLASIDPIFTVAALPDDHPHAVHVQRPPSVDQTLIRSPSIVSKLKSHLQRKSTSKSLKSQIYDADPGMLTSEEVLGCIESEEEQHHDRSPSSNYSTEDVAVICRVFDGSTEVEEQVKQSSVHVEESNVGADENVGAEKSNANTDQIKVNASTPEHTQERLSKPSTTLEQFTDQAPEVIVEHTNELPLPKSQGKALGSSSLARLSTSRTLSTLQPPPSTLTILQPSKDTVIPQATSETSVAKSLLTPEGESFADYERKLSVCGDDRRWGASCDFQKYAEIQQEDKPATGLIARMRASRTTSRASNTLMESALERQLQGKALFRSPSKLEVDTPSFVTTTWTGANHQVDDGDLDPLDACNVNSDDPLRKQQPSREVPASWCRWSSYDRGSRAGAAGIEDDMHVRDFATPLPYVDRGHLTSPTVIKLKNVKRYYKDLFTTSGFHGKGHRTSIWASGKLRDPELEMLPPSMPTYTDEEPPDWVEGKHCSLPQVSLPSAQRSSGSEGTNIIADNIPTQSDGADDMTAQQLSEMYSDCVSRPFSPVKITRYPSATVIDDRKGHWRSISLISEKSFLRESSNDLLRLVEREKEKCERLIMG